MQHMHGIITYLFGCCANPAVQILLLKRSVGEWSDELQIILKENYSVLMDYVGPFVSKTNCYWVWSSKKFCLKMDIKSTYFALNERQFKFI